MSSLVVSTELDDWDSRPKHFFSGLTPVLYGQGTFKSSSCLTIEGTSDSLNKMEATMALEHDINDFLNRRIADHANIVTDKSNQKNENQRSETFTSNLGNNETGDSNERVRYKNEFEKCNRFISFSVYTTWLILMVMAYFREFLRKYGFEKNLAAVEREEQRSFPPLYSSFESVYARNCYNRVRDVFERPISSVPGAKVKLLDRKTDDYGWTFRFTGTESEVINVGSYNYLGFAENMGSCAENSASVIDELGLSVCSTVHEMGQTRSQEELEKLVAEFLGVEEAICFSMGFATNSMNTACLVDKNALIISDQYNHASLVLGCRMSGAAIKVFKHNDVKSLEKTIRDAIVNGNPKTRKPYTKILIMVEGIYSMEGSICNLPKIIELKKKYGCYLYLDEAHSIGAMGDTGRGVVEYWGCEPTDIDVLMGTFTKSFGSAGGYLAGSKDIISHLRRKSPTGFYALSMSPPVATQIYTSMSIIMGRNSTNEGRNRIERLHRNTRYFRLKLKQKGFIVYGSDDSPVVPVLIYYPTKCGLWGREMLKRKVGVVVVSFPATEMTESRCRFCISAAHTKEMLDHVLNAIDEVGEMSRAKHSYRTHLYQDLDIQW
ncbi:Serine palmitoyltransferase 2 [Aphelenchoides besseyi]|nr:Serine palmitoyltransferase 2 [Aphelenchoides besseyi]KAI6199836.1 Serine palmitoyltransferase 2 [Aphelenchoides besseyi]